MIPVSRRGGGRGEQVNLSFYQLCDQASEWVRSDQPHNDNWTVYNVSIRISHSSKPMLTRIQLTVLKSIVSIFVGADHYSYQQQTISSASLLVSRYEI